MILISHRGNVNGREPSLENGDKYCQEAIDKGYNVEIDTYKLFEITEGKVQKVLSKLKIPKSFIGNNRKLITYFQANPQVLFQFLKGRLLCVMLI